MNQDERAPFDRALHRARLAAYPPASSSVRKASCAASDGGGAADRHPPRPRIPSRRRPLASSMCTSKAMGKQRSRHPTQPGEYAFYCT